MKIIKVAATFLAILFACAPHLTRYTVTFWGSFDTMTQIVGYAPSPEEFALLTDSAIDRFSERGRIYDRFHETKGLVNLASLNRAAGKGAQRVPAELMALLTYALEAKALTGGVVDLCLGPVTELWRQEISAAQQTDGTPPGREALLRAARQASDGALLLDQEKHTAELTRASMLLDVGALAKGYATELLARDLALAGLSRFAVSSGGNIRAHGAPPGADGWRVGIQNPEEALLGEAKSLARVVVRDGAVATSGDYQRFFICDGKKMHHVIDPVTLWPAERCRAVTVVASDAALADLLSTALFVLGPEQGEKLAAQCDAAAFWVLSDGTTRRNAAMERLLEQGKA